MHLPTDERLLKALADAIVVYPRATLKELAEAAGVSKATLHLSLIHISEPTRPY